MDRRGFLQAAAAAGSLAAERGAGAPKKPAPERRNEKPGMTYARLGRTNLMVSRIAHGSLHTNMQRIPLLAKLYEGGVNLYDTSHIYGGGRSEQAFGAFFGRENRRKNVFISTKLDMRRELKAGKGVYRRAMAGIDAALRRLRTDHVDILMLHGVTTMVDHLDDPEWLRALDDMKKRGKIRFTGFSEHQKPAAVLRRAAASGKYDVGMVAFSLVKATWGILGRADLTSMGPALAAARKADMGIMVIKAATRAEQIVAAAREPRLKKKGFSPYQLCYRYILDREGVDAVTCGMSNMTHVKENLAVPAIELSAGRKRDLEGGVAAARVCGFCGSCTDACPNGVAVQDIMRFNGYHGHGYRAAARSGYRSLPPAAAAGACRDCGACEAACPARVPIRAIMKETRRVLA